MAHIPQSDAAVEATRGQVHSIGREVEALHLAAVALAAAPAHRGAIDASLDAHRTLLRASVNFWETRWLEAAIRDLERRRSAAS